MTGNASKTGSFKRYFLDIKLLLDKEQKQWVTYKATPTAPPMGHLQGNSDCLFINNVCKYETQLPLLRSHLLVLYYFLNLRLSIRNIVPIRSEYLIPICRRFFLNLWLSIKNIVPIRSEIFDSNMSQVIFLTWGCQSGTLYQFAREYLTPIC